MEDKSRESSEWQQIVRITRYEQPPPGFQAALRKRIHARIEEIEVERAKPWWHRWIKPITGRPALIWANALTAVGLGFVALSISQTAKNPGALPKGTVTLNDLQPTGAGFAASPLQLLASPTPPEFTVTQAGFGGIGGRTIPYQMVTQAIWVPITVSFSGGPMSGQNGTFESTNPIPAGLFQSLNQRQFSQVSLRTGH
ncbi:MAG TPA: hypothetical protein VMF06_15150 [Candidatus Limnocylindria bacterium]|jgi:hypothetical protein|nr:hypothetical protein [Candidatus Limnocylindria bacterium]